VHAVKIASIVLAANLKRMCPPLTTCIYVRSATGLTIGCALRTLAAAQRGGKMKLIRMTTGPALAVLTLMMNKNRKDTLIPFRENPCA